jgi:hypothetical protein
LAVLTTVLAAAPAQAHRLGADCTLKASVVHVEAYFDDDSPARGARVRVEDDGDTTIVEGRTDADGHWTFPAPGPGKYTVRVDAGPGHAWRGPITIPESPAPVAGDPADKGNPEGGVRVSEGPDRQAITRIDWLKVGTGLGVIAAAAVAWRLSRLGRRPAD